MRLEGAPRCDPGNCHVVFHKFDLVVDTPGERQRAKQGVGHGLNPQVVDRVVPQDLYLEEAGRLGPSPNSQFVFVTVSKAFGSDSFLLLKFSSVEMIYSHMLVIKSGSSQSEIEFHDSTPFLAFKTLSMVFYLVVILATFVCNCFNVYYSSRLPFYTPNYSHNPFPSFLRHLVLHA